MTAVVAAWLVVAALVPPTPDPRVEDSRLSRQHLRLIMASTPSVPDATLRVVFDTGSLDDGDKPGITGLSLYTLLEAGPTPYTRFQEALFAAGAVVRLDVGVRECSWTLTTGADKFPALATLVLERVFNKKITPRDLANARQRMLHDGAAGNSTASLLAVFAGVALGDPHQGNRSVEGDPADGITLDQVQQHLNDMAAPANITLILTGNFAPARFKPWEERYKGGVKKDVERARITVPADHEAASRQEMHLLAYPLTLKGLKDVAAARVVSMVLEERLTNALIAAGVAQAPSVELVTQPWLDMVLVVLPIRPDGVARAHKVVEAELQRVQQGTILPEEYERARSTVLAQQDVKLQGSRALAEMIARTMHRKDATWVRLVGAFRELTLEAVKDWAGRSVVPASRVSVHLSREAWEKEVKRRAQKPKPVRRRK